MNNKLYIKVLTENKIFYIDQQRIISLFGDMFNNNIMLTSVKFLMLFFNMKIFFT